MEQTHSLPKELTAMMLVVTAGSPKRALLLESRKHQLWMPPGGHVEPAENPFEAALREVKEETGLDVRSYFPAPKRYDAKRVEVPVPLRIVEVRVSHGGRDHYHVDCLYRAEVPSELPVQHDDTESAGIGWFTLAQIADLTIPADILPILEEELAQ